MIGALERTLFAPVAAVRPYLALKCTLLLLGLDMWLERASHGGRYGVGGFNVAHFGWLDALQPEVSPALYVGVCVLTGALCVVIALASRVPRALIGLAFALHTWSWAMSMLDSYQHHYLLSLVLLAMIFFPRLSADEALLPAAPEAPPPAPAPKKKPKGGRGGKKRKGASEKSAPPKSAAPSPLRAATPLTSAWAYMLLAGSVAVVYAYTAYSKTDPEWLSGAALRSVLHLPDTGLPRAGALDPIGPFRELLALFGVTGQPLWWFMGHSVVLVQILCAVGYLLAPFLDVTKHWIPRAYAFVAMFTALSFHFGAEYMDLKVGWFSWYMIGYALIFFLPARWLLLVARVLVPLPGRGMGPEVMAIRIGVGLGVVLAGASAASWTELSPFGVSLAGIFGEGMSWPLVLLGGALLALTPIRLFARVVTTTKSEPKTWRTVALSTVGAGAVGLAAAGYAVDLPGAAAAGVIAAVGLGAAVIASLLRGDDPRQLHGYGLGATVAALALLFSMVFSEVRWDFYRNVGGDHRRRGEVREAYIAYGKANLYAPDGEDRVEQQEAMARILRERGELPPASGPTP